jgi:hypothetical protein
MLFATLLFPAVFFGLAALAVIGFILVVVFLGRRNEYGVARNRFVLLSMSDFDEGRENSDNQIHEVPDQSNIPSNSPLKGSISQISGQSPRPPIVSGDSIIDVTGQASKIPDESEKGGLVKYEPGVPFWQHQYVYSSSEIQQASKKQQAFYFHFRDSFVKGIYYDLEDNSNYAFVLLFDFIGGYDGSKLATVERHLEKLGEHYPKTKPYIRSSLSRRMTEIQDYVGLDRLRDIQELDPFAVLGGYGHGDRQFGNRHKKRLGLTNDEVKILNRLHYPPNNTFLEIQFCCDQVIRLYLRVISEITKALTAEGEILDVLIRRISDAIVRGHFRYKEGSWGHTYYGESTSNDLYLLIFKYCENAVRGHFGHKRKLKTELNYSGSTLVELRSKLIQKIESSISAGMALVEELDEASEIEINTQNTTRWKSAFEKLKERAGTIGADKFVDEVRHLGHLNQNNPSVEMIFFEASKFASKVDKESALALYVYYLDCDLRSLYFDNRKLTKTIQKSLFSNNEQLRDFEKIISDLISTRDRDKALSSVSQIYAARRKHLKLNTDAIQEARHKHSDTVELLNEYLQDEFEDEQNTIVAEEINDNEVQIEITPKVDPGPSLSITTVVGLTQVQSGLLMLFARNNLSVSQDEIGLFAKNNGLFQNQMIESLNEACFEIVDDVLIEEDDEHYVINEDYFRMISPK